MSVPYIRLFLSLLLFLVGGTAQAAPSADLCEWATQQAARESGVPVDILGALTLTETGRRIDGVVRPWAWSANSEGAGSWFETPAEAIAFAESRIAGGRHNLDIGCFQLNYRWHGENFVSVQQMFDPLENARYAARFVSQLYTEMGDWRAAAGAFHSRTPVHANRYLARFDTLRTVFQQQGFKGMTATPETYNSFAAVQPTRRSAVLRERVMLLGAPVGSQSTGRAGSLAVLGRGRVQIAGARGPIIGTGRARPLFAQMHPSAIPEAED